MPRRTRRRGNRVGWSNPLEFSSRPPATIDQAPDIKGLVQPSCGHAPRDSNATFIPNVVYQAWLGGGKLMFAKLLSVLSIHYIMKPQRHTIFYDEEPNDALVGAATMPRPSHRARTCCTFKPLSPNTALKETDPCLHPLVCRSGAVPAAWPRARRSP